MKLISWNVNGIRAALGKGLPDFLASETPDILCLQETKARPEQVELPLEFQGYQAYWNSAEKAGYSGTAIFTKQAPLSCQYGFGIEEHDREGRVLTLEYPEFYLVNVYTVNAQDGLKRLEYRLDWDAAFQTYVTHLAKQKPVIFCGDLNVAHEEIDLARPKDNHKSAGFSDEERASFSHLLQSGFCDTYRHFYPNTAGAYSWWSYRAGARERNVGWRIDYFCVSQSMLDRVVDAKIYPHILGSDHCPVSLHLK